MQTPDRQDDATERTQTEASDTELTRKECRSLSRVAQYARHAMEQGTQSPMATENSAVTATQKASILVVDDNPGKRLALASVLESLNENVVLAGSGEDALRLLLHHDYAVILLDVQMPEMDGFETASLIRSRKRSEHIPIIFVTAYIRAETDMLQGYSLGAVDYIFTPIIPEILRAKVSVFVELYHKTQAIKRHGEQLESLVAQRTAALTAEIAERMQTQERLHYLAHHDVLTDMPNRMLFVERLKQAIARAQRRKQFIAVLFLDLDRFKLVNDTLGHEAGDRLLQTMSAQLMAVVREGDTVARFGGDEFAVFLSGISSPDDVSALAKKFLDALATPFAMDGHEFFITCSIGIGLYPNDGTDTQTLMKNADTAMYRAKQQGGNNFQFFQNEMKLQSLKRLELETDLRHALERGDFLLHYQPQFDAKTGALVGVEALLRWQRNMPEILPPDEFLHLLEESGLIVQVGEWVIHTACTQHKEWCAAGLPQIRVAVNASSRQFTGNALVLAIRRVMGECDMHPSFLEIEITENAIMHHTQGVVETLQELDAIGIRFAIDDFGTGYSSLTYLKRFPISVLKIDQTFVHDILTSPHDTAIAKAIIQLAHSLELQVIAEGVETAEQLAFLKAQGCDIVQGDYLSPALSADDVTALIRDRHARSG